MDLLKISFLNGIASIVRIGLAIGLNKVIAIYVGPGGYALIGQLANMLTVATTLGGGAICTGVTKLTAQYYGRQFKQRNVWRIATRFILISSACISLLICIFSHELASSLMGSSVYKTVFYLLAIALPLMAFNSLIVSILNGKKEASLFVLQNILASLVSAITSVVLAIAFGIFGALTALIVNQALILFVTLWVSRKCSWMRFNSFVGKVRFSLFGPITQFALMSLISALAAPISQMQVREHITQNFGVVAAGEWQGIFKISEIYLMLFTSTLSVYYLPRIAEINKISEIKIEILKIYKLLIPISILLASSIYLLRDFIVVSLFSREFMGMTELFTWQLVGDVIKIGSWVFGFIMVGRGMTGWFIFTEVLFSSSWVLISMLLTKIFGLQGVFIAFSVNYSLYWVFMVWLIRYKLMESEK